MNFLKLQLKCISLQFHLFSIFVLASDVLSSEYDSFRGPYFDNIGVTPCKEIHEKGQNSLKYFINHSSTDVCWIIALNKLKFLKLRVSYLNLPLKGYSHLICGEGNAYLSVESLDSNLDGEHYSSDYFLSESPSTKFFCGSEDAIFLPTYTFYTNKLKIHLHANYNPWEEVNLGFQLDYEIDETCDSNIELRSYDFIVPPIVSSSAFTNIVCTWNISLPSSNLPIQLLVNKWSTLGSSTVRVYDGQSGEAPVLATFYNYFKNVYSTGPYMFIEYTNHHLYQKYISFNITVLVKGYCLPGTRPCGDGKQCYNENARCDGKKNCSNGNDELGCVTHGCRDDQYWCGAVGSCYSAQQRCNGKPDCHHSRVDEEDCDYCSNGAFYCPSARKCIYERWICDGQVDCTGSEDEKDCPYTVSRRVITAAIVGFLICGLLLAIALGCSCKLYSLRNASVLRNRRNRHAFPTPPIGRLARELLRREAPPSYHMTVGGEELSESSRTRSSSSRRRRERRRRRRNRENLIRRAQPAPRPTSTTPQENPDEESLNTASSRRTSSSATTTSTLTSNRSESLNSSHPAPVGREEEDDVGFILAELGLTDFPAPASSEAPVADLAPETPVSNEAPSTSTSQSEVPPPAEATPTETVAADDNEAQAGPLPKKRIRPVMVEAPFNSVLADDIPACVYPNPPSYTEAMLSGESPDPPVVQTFVEQKENPTLKPTAGPKQFLNKIWKKPSPKKNRDTWKIPSIFSSNSRSDSSIQLDEEQVRLISEFGSEDSISFAGNDNSPIDTMENPSTHGLSHVQLSESKSAADKSSLQSSIDNTSSPVQTRSLDGTTIENHTQFLHENLVSLSSSEPLELRINCQSSFPSDVHAEEDTSLVESSLTTSPPVWSSRSQVLIPEMRLETLDQSLTLNTNGSVSERT